MVAFRYPALQSGSIVEKLHEAHKFGFFTLQHLLYKWKKLVFCQLSLLEDLFNGAKVRLNLVLGVQIHAQLLLSLLQTLHIAFYMGNVYNSKGSLNFLFFYNGCWQICSSLIANINELFKPILEPWAGKSVLLHLTLFLLKFSKKSVTFVKASSWLGVVNRLGTSRSLTLESVSSLWWRIVKVFIAFVFIGFLIHSLHHIKLVGFILIHS